MPLPTAAFDPTKTVVPQKSIAVFTPTGGTAVNLIGKVANYDQSMEFVRREVPGSDNLLRADRIVPIRQSESFKFELEEVARLVDVFGGLSGAKQGTVELYIVDPDDAAGKVAIKTNAFSCLATLEGGINFSANEFSKGTIMFEAREKITFTIDATV